MQTSLFLDAFLAQVERGVEDDVIVRLLLVGHVFAGENSRVDDRTFCRYASDQGNVENRKEILLLFLGICSLNNF